MQPTTDVALVCETLKRAFGHEAVAIGQLAKPGVHAFADASGAVVYSSEGCGLYSIIVGRLPEADGAAFKRLLNDAIHWLFINTDALVVRGRIESENKACRALVPHVMGTRPARNAGGIVITDTTFARWAGAYGLDKAIEELRVAGQGDKAERLANAAGVRHDG